MSPDDIAGRMYGRVYNVSGRQDLHAFLLDAVDRSGGTVLYASSWRHAPVFLGVQTPGDERVGLLVYPFRANHAPIARRPPDERRFQIRYGGEATWDGEHPVARDRARVDTTLVLGVYLEREVFVGVDPALYDPFPMGISIEFKERHVDEAKDRGWCVFERLCRPGRRREQARASGGLETVVVFTPERLLDYVRLERQASDLGLDPPLRFAAAQAGFSAPRAPARGGGMASLHALEQEFSLPASEILKIIADRHRLTVAVRGGVAEHHLERVLTADPRVARVEARDQDAMHDFDVRMTDGTVWRVECKNASPDTYQDGIMKVEVQKTRASQGDPASRFYRVDQFDVVAACLYSPTREWTFRFQRTDALTRHSRFPDRIAPIQRIEDTWVTSLADLA